MNRKLIERIVAAVPNFHARWESFLQKWEPEGEPPWYLGMSELAHYIVENYSRGITSEFPGLFSTVESLLENPEPELENLIAVGLFEDIQNIASHREFGAEVFRQWLGERSRVVWDEVHAFMQRVAAWGEQQKPRWWQFWRKRKAFDAGRALSEVESPELKKIIESAYRKIK